MSSPLLKLIGVSRRYESPTGADSVPILHDISLEIGRGESVAIVGPSGSGKSTLLNILGTLDRPSSGQVLLDGRGLSGLDDIQLAAVRNREIGFIFQSHHLLPQMSWCRRSPTKTPHSATARSSARNDGWKRSVLARGSRTDPASSPAASASVRRSSAH